MSTAGWQPTTSLVRGALGSTLLILPAVVFGRPDLLVLATPLLVTTAWMLAHRPSAVPRVSTALEHTHVREGEGTVVRAVLAGADQVEHGVFAVRPHRSAGFGEGSGVRGAYVDRPRAAVPVEVPLLSLRWGRRDLGEGRVAATSRWAGFRYGPVPTLPLTLDTLPMPGRFDSRAPTPHPIGLVGLNPSTRPGDGSEFASIRPFTAGDKLRRIRWPVSLRTGTLHVTTAVAEQDSNVMLIVDALTDIGAGEGEDGEDASSLDVAVRAAGAVSEHYLHRGDRVGVRVLGPRRHNMVASGAGNAHLRRILDTLALIVPDARARVDAERMQLGLGAGAIVVVLSPMLAPEAINEPVALASRGLSVIVIDTLPDGLARQEDRRRSLAWRIRLLERDAMLRRVQVVGIPVVAWRGPGTLDVVLRRLGRRASQPRMARR